MALRRIMTEEEPTLHKTAKPVVKFDRRLHALLEAALPPEELPALEEHLKQRSRSGSRDDISVAVIKTAL